MYYPTLMEEFRRIRKFYNRNTLRNPYLTNYTICSTDNCSLPYHFFMLFNYMRLTLTRTYCTKSFRGVCEKSQFAFCPDETSLRKQNNRMARFHTICSANADGKYTLIFYFWTLYHMVCFILQASYFRGWNLPTRPGRQKPQLSHRFVFAFHPFLPLTF